MGNCLGKKQELMCNEVNETARISARISHIEQQLNTDVLTKGDRLELSSTLITYRNRLADLTWGNLTLNTQATSHDTGEYICMVCVYRRVGMVICVYMYCCLHVPCVLLIPIGSRSEEFLEFACLAHLCFHWLAVGKYILMHLYLASKPYFPCF